MKRPSLLTHQNAKTSKGEALGYLTGILYLTPSDGSGLGNLCPFASDGCRAACLYTAGRGQMSSVKAGRLRKTRLFFQDARAFVDMLAVDIRALERKAGRQGLTPCVRLNGTSDIPWEKLKGSDGLTLMEAFPHIQFYDYTKRPDRDGRWPNYHLTFSRSECNGDQAVRELQSGRNVAVVFDTRKGEDLPIFWNGYRVIDGDRSDLRFLDRPGPGCAAFVIGLRAKGDGKGDRSGFVVESESGLLQILDAAEASRLASVTRPNSWNSGRARAFCHA
jgi:hypothetical protein